MFVKYILIALLFFVFSQSQLIRVEQNTRTKSQSFEVTPKKSCKNKHTIYAVDRSASMAGPSWNIVLQFLTNSNFPTNQYKSLFTFWRYTWGPGLKNYHTIDWNPTLPPTNMQLPDGGANFDDALHRASQILNQNFVAQTCLMLISDGWTYWNQPALDQFNNSKNSFQKNTGCQVCVMCYLTAVSQWGKTPMEDLCDVLKAPVFQLDKSGPPPINPNLSTQKTSKPPIDAELVGQNPNR